MQNAIKLAPNESIEFNRNFTLKIGKSHSRQSSRKSLEDGQAFYSVALTGARVWAWVVASGSSSVRYQSACEILASRGYDLLVWVLVTAAAAVALLQSVLIMMNFQLHSTRVGLPPEKLVTSRHIPRRQAALFKIVL